MTDQPVNTTVKIEGATVVMHDRLNWGQREKIMEVSNEGMYLTQDVNTREQTVHYNAKAKLEAKYVTVEVCIKSITTDDGKNIPFTREWLNNLSVEDGDAVLVAANAVSEAKKK